MSVSFAILLPSVSAFPPPGALSRVAQAVCVLSAAAAVAVAHAPVLAASESVAEPAGRVLSEREQEQVLLEADALHGEMEGLTVLQGRALLQQGVLRISANRLEYDAARQQAVASGAVSIERDGDRITGSQLQYSLQSRTGSLQQPAFVLADRVDGVRAKGSAKHLSLLSRGRLRGEDVRYTTCACEGDSIPAWQLRANNMTIDREANVGYAKGAHLRFYDRPILGIPAITFPVTGERKSGFLPPSLSLDSVSGVGWKQPYYWNIAPQYDATLTPELLSRRGISMGSEFRYLGGNYSGQVQVNVLPNDRLRRTGRWALAWEQRMSLGLPFQPLTIHDHLTLEAQVNRVSDSNYWRDFTDSEWRKRFLPSELHLQLGYGAWTASAQVLRWQTQQVPDSVVEVPYDRLPWLALSYGKSDGAGWDYRLGGEWVRFRGDARARRQPNGSRGRLYAQASYLYDRSLWRIRPALHLDYTHYRLDAPVRPGAPRVIARALPTLSLDASMQFERQTTLLGTGYRQTLEPRALYVYTPYRNQSDIPVYEAAEYAFNFASIFAARSFTGHDRVSDNNLLTLGVTSRYLNPQDGAQKLRLAFAQRIRLAQRRVTLPGGVPDKAGWSDMLFGADVRLSERWRADGVLQYNPERGKSDRLALNLNYHPAPYRVFNIGYRFQRDRSEHLDLSWQWPLAGMFRRSNATAGAANRWYTVGRINYSHRDRKVTDSLLGLEYDGQCWVGRLVVQHNQSGSSANRRIMAQLEFVGFSSVGTDPLETLRHNIEHYQRIRQMRADDGMSVRRRLPGEW